MLPKVLLVCLALILVSCQTSPMVPPGPTPTPPVESFEGKAQVGSYEMKIQCEGIGEPTIILENSIGFKTWNSGSLARFKAITRTCQYLHLGMSSEKIEGLRTSMDQAKDLHALLTQTGVPGPYILVGHMTADFMMILYTDQYPKEVAGLVCLDCFPAGIYSNFLQKMEYQSPNNTPAFTDARRIIASDNDDHSRENLDFLSSEQQVLKVTTLGDVSFILLISGMAPHGETVLKIQDPKINQLFEESWAETSLSLSRLSTRGRIETIPADNISSIRFDPKVDAAIQELVTAVRSGK